MMPTIEQLIDVISQPDSDRHLERDIIKLAPNLTVTDAHRIQIGAKKRRVAGGDRIVGYQASYTSRAAQAFFPTMPVPTAGTLLASIMRTDGETVEKGSDALWLETEIGVLLRRDLVGPGVLPAHAAAAIEAYFPAFEISPLRAHVMEGLWSDQHLIAVQKAAGYVVVGTRLTSPKGFDPRLEGVQVSMNGRVRASATGVEAMGSPVAAVAAVANRLAEVGEHLRAGEIVITGSLPPPQSVEKDVSFAQAEYTRLGRLGVCFAD